MYIIQILLKQQRSRWPETHGQLFGVIIVMKLIYDLPLTSCPATQRTSRLPRPMRRHVGADGDVQKLLRYC